MELVDNGISWLAAKCWLLGAPSNWISLIQIDDYSAYTIDGRCTDVGIYRFIGSSINSNAIVVDKTILISR